MTLQARYWRAALSIAALLPIACVKTPESYPIPDQHQPFRASSADPEYVVAGSKDASRYFVRDIRIDAGLWRWTGAQPELEFTLTSTHNRTLVYEFVINEETFKHTGPVHISFLVNGKLIAREIYDTPGDKKLEKLISEELLQATKKTRVTAHVENTWQSPDGVIFGILLKRAGFI
ncbi:MAG TPA: hypothetical protein VEX68_03925 [Bryobacteraceae bacterium]|nr:hypothetical protein [Bryobacteraceae bacterium]